MEKIAQEHEKAAVRAIAETKAADIKSDAAKRRVENKAAAKAAAVKKADEEKVDAAYKVAKEKKKAADAADVLSRVRALEEGELADQKAVDVHVHKAEKKSMEFRLSIQAKVDARLLKERVEAAVAVEKAVKKQ